MIKLTSSYEIYIKKLFELMVFILIIILGVTIMGCKKESVKKPEAKIIVWQKGKKTVLKPDSPHFKELQTAGEEMLTSVSDILPLIVYPKDIKYLRSKEFSLEITYHQPKEFIVYPLRKETNIEVSRFLIPLSGKFAYPAQTIFWGDRKGYGAGPYSTSKKPDKIKTLLQTMDITR